MHEAESNNIYIINIRYLYRRLQARNLNLDESDIEIPNNNNEEVVDSIEDKVKSMSLEEKK